MYVELPDFLYAIFVWIYLLPFRIKSYIFASSTVTAFNYQRARAQPDLQYHAQYLHGYEHPTNLFLIYHTTDTVFSLHSNHRFSRTLTSLRAGQWFRIHTGDYEGCQLQVGYAVLNRVVERQETQVVVELIAAVAEWEGSNIIWVAIPYTHIHPGVVFQLHAFARRSLHPNNMDFPLTIQTKPEAVALNPLVHHSQHLRRLPYLPIRPSYSPRSSFSSFESLITAPAPVHTYPPSGRRTRKISLHF